MSARRRQKIGTGWPYRPIWPTSGRRRQHIGTNRPYLPIWPTSGRHRTHVQTWSRPDICRHAPISARYNFRHQADIAADISRYRADIWPICLCYLGIDTMTHPTCIHHNYDHVTFNTTNVGLIVNSSTKTLPYEGP